MISISSTLLGQFMAIWLMLSMSTLIYLAIDRKFYTKLIIFWGSLANLTVIFGFVFILVLLIKRDDLQVGSTKPITP